MLDLVYSQTAGWSEKGFLKLHQCSEAKVNEKKNESKPLAARSLGEVWPWCKCKDELQGTTGPQPQYGSYEGKGERPLGTFARWLLS